MTFKPSRLTVLGPMLQSAGREHLGIVSMSATPNPVADVATRPLTEFTPLDVDVLRCPHQFNARMRSEAPIYQLPAHRNVFRLRLRHDSQDRR